MDLQYLDPRDIRPPHEVREPEKFLALTDDMEKYGWKGRPLLVGAVPGGRYVGITGSHRTHAARAADLLEVPAMVFEQQDLPEGWTIEPDGLYVDGDRMLSDAEIRGRLRGAGLDDSPMGILMRDEHDANQRERETR